MASKLCGILVGPEELRVLALRVRRNSMEVAGAVAHDLTPEERPEPGVALKAVLKKLKAAPSRAALCLAKEQVTLLHANLPSVNPLELKDMARFEAERHIPFNAERHGVGYQVLRNLGSSSEVLLAAADAPVIDRALNAAQEAGVRPDGLNVSSACLMNALLYSNAELAKSKTIAMVSVGISTVDFVFASEGRIFFTRSVPHGLRNLINELHKSQGIEASYLDTGLISSAARLIDMIDLEHNYTEEAKPEGTLGPKACQAARAWVGKLIQDLRRSYDYARREMLCPPIQALVLSGEGAILSNLDRYLYVNLNLEIHLLHPLAAMKGKGLAELPFGGLEMTVAFGAAVQHMVPGAYKLDLTPRAYYRQLERRRLVRRMIATGVLFLAAGSLGVASYMNLQTQQAELAQRINKMNDQALPLVKGLKEQETQLNILQAYLQDPSNAMAVLSHVTQYPKSPQKINVTVKSMAFTRAFNKTDQFVIEGHAGELTDVTKFVEYLQGAQPRLFDEVLPIEQTVAEPYSNRGKVYRFRIQCAIPEYKGQFKREKIADTDLSTFIATARTRAPETSYPAAVSAAAATPPLVTPLGTPVAPAAPAMAPPVAPPVVPVAANAAATPVLTPAAPAAPPAATTPKPPTVVTPGATPARPTRTPRVARTPPLNAGKAPRATPKSKIPKTLQSLGQTPGPAATPATDPLGNPQ